MYIRHFVEMNSINPSVDQCSTRGRWRGMCLKLLQCASGNEERIISWESSILSLRMKNKITMAAIAV